MGVRATCVVGHLPTQGPSVVLVDVLVLVLGELVQRWTFSFSWSNTVQVVSQLRRRVQKDCEHEHEHDYEHER